MFNLIRSIWLIMKVLLCLKLLMEDLFLLFLMEELLWQEQRMLSVKKSMDQLLLKMMLNLSVKMSKMFLEKKTLSSRLNLNGQGLDP